MKITKIIVCLTWICITQITNLWAQGKVESLALPSSIQLAWQDMELTTFIHFGPATWQNQEYDDLNTPLSRINPVQLDTDEWAKVARSYGSKMIIMVAKHTGGFCWWPTTTTDYNISHTPWKEGKGDLIKDLSKSCKKYGLKFGIYLSPEDQYLKVGMGGTARNPEFQATYEKIYRKQLTELLTQYGDISEIWVDGSLVFDISDLIARHAPRAVVLQSSAASIRWVGNEMGFAPYPAWNSVSKEDARSGNTTASNGTPWGTTWLPLEVDVSIRRPNWFWRTNNEDRVLTLEELLQIYYASVGRGTVFLTNLCPDTLGCIPAKDAAVLKAFGTELKQRFGKPLAETKGEGEILLLNMKKTKIVDHVVLMEDIKYGERIRKFVLEGKQGDVWMPLFDGISIGHKLIIQLPSALQLSHIRLRITDAVGTPKIRSMKAFFVNKPTVIIPEIQDNWNIKHIGTWTTEELAADIFNVELELSDYCKDARQYELAFVAVPEDGTSVKFSYDWQNTGLWLDNLGESNRLNVTDIQLLFTGANANHYLYDNKKFKDRIIFNLTGIPTSLIVQAKIKGVEKLKNRKIEGYLLRK